MPWDALLALIDPHYPKAGRGRPPIRWQRCSGSTFCSSGTRWGSGDGRSAVRATSPRCARWPTAHVAELFGLHSSTVRTVDRRRLEAIVAALPPGQPTRLMMDEFALYKGHRNASVVLDADTRRVLWIGQGRSRAAVRPFFLALGPEGCARIEAVAMGNP